MIEMKLVPITEKAGCIVTFSNSWKQWILIFSITEEDDFVKLQSK